MPGWRDTQEILHHLPCLRGALGNVRMETLRGFSLEDMKKIIGKMP